MAWYVVTCPQGTWQRVRRTERRKGVRFGWRRILEARVGGMGAGGGWELVPEDTGTDRPIAKRISVC